MKKILLLGLSIALLKINVILFTHQLTVREIFFILESGFQKVEMQPLMQPQQHTRIRESISGAKNIITNIELMEFF